MSNLLRSELYKLTRSRAFPLMLALLAFSAAAYCAMSYFDDPNDGGALQSTSGLDLFAAGLGGNVYIIKIGLTVLAGFFISSEYSSGTMKRAVASGHSRGRVILAKTTIFLLGSAIVALVFPLVNLVVGSLLFGVGSLPDVETAAYIVRCLGLAVTLAAAHGAIVALMGTYFNDSGKTIGVGIVFFFFIDGVFGLIGSHVAFVRKIYEYSVLSEISRYYDPALSARDIWLSVFIPAATTAVFLLLCAWAFRKKEIK